jgi:hypothetical protein
MRRYSSRLAFHLTLAAIMRPSFEIGLAFSTHSRVSL